MRALWILILLLFALNQSEAQLDSTDRDVLTKYASDRNNTNLKGQEQIDSSQLFYLVRWKANNNGKEKKSAQLVRQLSSQYAIVIISDQNQLLEVQQQSELIVSANDDWKLPPGIKIDSKNASTQQWIVTALDTNKFVSDAKELGIKMLDNNRATNSFLIQLPDSGGLRKLLHSKNIIFLQALSTSPKEELLINGFDLGTNQINVAHAKFPSLNGSGLVVSVKENQFDSTDIDFKGRYVRTGLASSVVTGHASIMATMIGGGGNSYHLGKGVAWNSLLGSSNFAQLLPSPDAIYNQLHISVENHSYGTAIENFYGADAAAYDASVINNPFLVHVFSSGNSGTSTSSSGTYAGILNFANLTGSFKMAKNIITVGATDSFYHVEVLSSRGPAYDGRVKPDLVAFGQDGSSGAAALVSGTALLIQQAYKGQHQDSLPPASLVKACVINAADEMGTPGPDYISGYGSLNVFKSIAAINDRRYCTNKISNKSTQHIPITIPAGVKQVRITMAYSDTAAQPNALRALVNDLDIELVESSNGKTWKPWVLNAVPNKDSLVLPAKRGRDSLNNVEVITLDTPAAGLYDLSVFGFNVANTSQEYAIVYAIDSMQNFYWAFPLRPDPVFAGDNAVARWATTIEGSGTIEFSGNNGQTWQTALSNVQLNNKYTHWLVPDSFSTGLLRMQANGKTYVSDTFEISRNIQLRVGFNCKDSVLLQWNKIDRADQYHLYALGSKFLESLSFIKDTFFVFAKKDISAKHFAVAPVRSNAEGMRGYTINYETQGVGCYIKSFLAQLANGNGSLSLELGTLYLLKQIEIQKDNSSGFNTIQTISNPTSLNLQFDGVLLHQGLNTFRIKLTLTNGTTIFSNEETLYFTGTNDYIIYPNPAPASTGFTLLRKDPQEEMLMMYDLYGRRIFRTTLSDIITLVNTSSLQKGVYLIIVLDKNGNRKHNQKLVVQ